MRPSDECEAGKSFSACVFGHSHRILVTTLLFGSQPSPALPIFRFPFAWHPLINYKVTR